MALMVEAGGWPIGSAMIGVGVWVMFALWWRGLGAFGEEAGLRLASFGLAMGAALAGGYGLGGWLGGGASSLGAVLGAGGVSLMGWLYCQDAERRARWLGAGLVAGFAGLAVSRLGCVVAGCDFGATMWPGDEVWLQRHARGTPAFELQVLSGQLSPTARWSKPTLAFAPLMVLSFGGGALAVAAVLRRRGAGSAWVPGVGALTFVAAALVELTRAPISVSRWVGSLPVSALLYALVAVALGALALRWWQKGRRELRIPAGNQARLGPRASGVRQV